MKSLADIEDEKCTIILLMLTMFLFCWGWGWLTRQFTGNNPAQMQALLNNNLTATQPFEMLEGDSLLSQSKVKFSCAAPVAFRKADGIFEATSAELKSDAYIYGSKFGPQGESATNLQETTRKNGQVVSKLLHLKNSNQYLYIADTMAGRD